MVTGISQGRNRNISLAGATAWSEEPEGSSSKGTTDGESGITDDESVVTDEGESGITSGIGESGTTNNEESATGEGNSDIVE